MCGCNCIIRHILLYFSTYCPLLGIIILLVKVILKCRYMFILPPTVQKGRLVRSPLPFPLGQRYGLPEPSLDHHGAKNVSVPTCSGFHPIRWDCCTQGAVEGTAEALTGGEWHSLTFPWGGLPYACLMSSFIALGKIFSWCQWLPAGTAVPHSPHWASEPFYFSRSHQMEGSTLCNNSLFYCRNERWTLRSPRLHHINQSLSSPLATQSSRWSVESKGLGHEGSLAAVAWGLRNTTRLLAWPWLCAHPCSRPSPGHWNFQADGLRGHFSAHAPSNSTPVQAFGEQQDRCH